MLRILAAFPAQPDFSYRLSSPEPRALRTVRSMSFVVRAALIHRRKRLDFATFAIRE
jgi:hypothetical protein